jgi:PAS domain S-box-containing protein
MKPYHQMSRDELLQELARKEMQTDSEREITLRLLNLLNTGDPFKVLMESLLCFFQELSGCEAVGVRLHDGDDYPYYETRGFPGSFVQAENKLCVKDLNGQILRDEIGDPVLECVCGNVLCGRFDCSKPFYTARGSFWSNCTSELLAGTREPICPGTMRNRCNSAGYESMALIPLCSQGAVLGLMQFNDRRPGQFSPDLILLLERLADSMAIAIVRAETDKALQQANSYNRSLFEASLDMLVTIGPDGKITDANTATEAATGLRREDLVNTDFAEYFTEPAKARAVYRKVFRKEDVRDFPLYIKCPQGRSLPVLYNASIYRDAAGNVAGVLASARDITERKRAAEALRRSEQRLLFHLENSPLAVVEWDADFIITQWSIEAERIFGWHSGEALGSTFSSLNLVHGDEVVMVHRIIKRLNSGKERTLVSSSRNITKSGAVIDCMWYYSVLSDGNGQMSSVLSLVQDVTEHKQMQEKLLKSRNELKLANELLEQRVKERTADLEVAIREQESFSYSVSHDLRAPLRHINSFSSILIEDYGENLPELARGYLERIIASSGKMGDLIDHLLKLSRVTRSEIKPGIVDLSKLAAATLNMYRDTDPREGAEFVIEKGITAMGDKVLLGQLLENLLGNAWKYTSKKPVSCIRFGKAVVSGHEAYYVKDNGTGFDMAYRERLFNAFERLHGNEFEGVGIGLATAQRIVRRHGGAIWAEGAVDQGATFYFTLPVHIFKEV